MMKKQKITYNTSMKNEPAPGRQITGPEYQEKYLYYLHRNFIACGFNINNLLSSFIPARREKVKKIYVIPLFAIVLTGLMECMEFQAERYVSQVNNAGRESAAVNSNTLKLEHGQLDQEVRLPVPDNEYQIVIDEDDYMKREFFRMSREMGADPVASAIFFLQFHILSERELK
jgi:hypothetical protein